MDDIGKYEEDRRLAQEWLIENLSVSRETLAVLDQFANLVLRWNKRINLVSRSDEPVLWTRHICDSAALISEFSDPTPHSQWLDLGSGGGFPGLVVALLLRDRRSSVETRLVDSDRRKCAFLIEAGQHLSLQVRVIPGRIEELPPQSAKTTSARAITSVRRFLELAVPHISADGEFRLLKGKSVQEELTDAAADWHMDYQVIPHPFSDGGHVLHIRKASRR